MPRSATLPFEIVRSADTYSGSSVTTTRERVHGLLHLDGDRLRIQWRRARTTDTVGALEVRSDREVEEVRELEVSIDRIGAVTVRAPWLRLIGRPRVVLIANDLTAFEAMAGAHGLELHHPAELVLSVRRQDRLAAEEFAAELALALAERSLTEGRRAEPLPPGGEERLGPGPEA